MRQTYGHHPLGNFVASNMATKLSATKLLSGCCVLPVAGNRKNLLPATEKMLPEIERVQFLATKLSKHQRAHRSWVEKYDSS